MNHLVTVTGLHPRAGEGGWRLDHMIMWSHASHEMDVELVPKEDL